MVIDHLDNTREDFILDRVERAPSPTRRTLPPMVQTDERQREVDTSGDEEDMYFVERISKHDQDPELPERHLYYMQWHGYAERTWEPADKLCRNILVRYHCRKKMALSPNIDNVLEDQGVLRRRWQ